MTVLERSSGKELEVAEVSYKLDKGPGLLG